MWYLRGMSYPRVLQWVPRITKKVTCSKRPFFWMTDMPKYRQKCNFWRRCKLYCSKLRPLNSNLRACIAHHKGLYSTLGPSSTTQRPLTSIRRFCTAPRVALENTIGPSRADTRIIRGHRLPISRYRDKLSATYRGQIAVSKIVDFLYNIRFS